MRLHESPPEGKGPPSTRTHYAMPCTSPAAKAGSREERGEQAGEALGEEAECLNISTGEPGNIDDLVAS